MRITTPDDIKALGTILCVFAHPDDETFTMGGILAVAAANGQKVIVLTATKGEGGVQDASRWPAETLGETRAAELQAALTELGPIEQQFLGYKDGTCAASDATVAGEQIANIIRQYQPDSIFSFGPEGLTGHPDHQAVAGWAVEARRSAGSSARLFKSVLTPEQYDGFRAVDKQFNFFFNTSRPPICAETEAALCLHLSDDIYARKIRALRAMPSQYDKLFASFEEAALRGGFGIETFVEA